MSEPGANSPERSPRSEAGCSARAHHFDATTRKLLLLNLVVTLITAWRSETFFHPDEHFQIIEFAGLKLGFTRPDELPWEFEDRLRPFMQPALYYALLKPLVSLGLSDRFLMLFIMRLVSALISFGALVSLLRTSAPWVSHPAADRARIRWLTLAGFIPYIAVRTTSENLSAACLLFALGLVVRGRSAEGRWNEQALLPTKPALLAGLLLGMCFEFRFQVAFAIVGLLVWMLVVARDLRATLVISLAGLAPIGLAVFVDRWGYGEWVFPPWNYLRVNMIEGVAATFGTKWFFAYLHITLANIFAPVVILATLGMILCWLRRPKHVLTWTTLPFVLAHSAIGHKEERFMFPVFLLALVGAAMGFEEDDARAPQAASAISGRATRIAEAVARLFRRFQQTWLYSVLVVANFLGMALLAVYPLGWRPHYQFAHWAYDLPEPIHFAYDEEDLLPPYPFLHTKPWHLHVLEPGERADAIETGGAPLYWLRREPFSEFDGDTLGVSDELVYTEFPGSRVTWLRENLWPHLGAWRTRLVSGGYPAKRSTWISAYRVTPRAPRPAGAD